MRISDWSSDVCSSDLLAEEKLDGIADAYRAIGCHEVRATLERPSDLYIKGSIYPATREPTEDEVARLADIDAEIEALPEAGGEDREGLMPLYDERVTITEGITEFNAAQVADGGQAVGG